MMTFMKKIIQKVLVLLMPVVLVLSAVRLLLTPVFLQIEYNLPKFPEDPYGFRKADRLYWSGIALEYLLNNEGIDYLADLKFVDGSMVYNERELRHMVDVKVVVQRALQVWIYVLLFYVISGVVAYSKGWKKDFWKAASQGGKLTVILCGLIILFVLVGFGVFFVAFHNMFFEPGTWTFLWSDTLIRLFPERFWRDTFLFVGGLSIVGGWLVFRLGKKLVRE